jgi:hypothetical protein
MADNDQAEDQPVVRDAKTGQFVKGKIGGPGRPKGSRNRLGEAFLQDMLADWEENGVAVIEAVRKEKPDQYLKVVASILPRDLNVNINPLEDATDDELVQRLRDLESVLRPFLSPEGGGGDSQGTGQAKPH